jgi:hypothetical protein
MDIAPTLTMAARNLARLAKFGPRVEATTEGRHPSKVDPPTPPGRPNPIDGFSAAC